MKREFRITDKLLEKYGLTDYCKGCVAKVMGDASRPHTQECRDRMEECIRQEDPEDELLTRRDARLRGKGNETPREAGQGREVPTKEAAATQGTPKTETAAQGRQGEVHAAAAAQGRQGEVHAAAAATTAGADVDGSSKRKESGGEEGQAKRQRLQEIKAWMASQLDKSKGDDVRGYKMDVPWQRLAGEGH